MRYLILVISLLLSSYTCASGNSLPPRPKLPYPSWYIGLVAPKHMEVWVESIDVIDRRGLRFFDVFGGVASYAGKVKGWQKGGGKTMPINNVDLPEQLYLRWQSLVEPQAYMISILIPQWVREEMLTPERSYCQWSKEWLDDYRQVITLGMAPGGIVKVWLGGPCLDFKEVGRFQAKIDPRGPNRDGNYIYHRPPNPKAQAYIDKHGIPYGSW
jgi:hypothetical protein